MGDVIGVQSEPNLNRDAERSDVEDFTFKSFLSDEGKDRSNLLSLTSEQQADSLLLSSLMSPGRAGRLVSDRLIAHFGSFALVVSSSATELCRFGGLTKSEVFTIKAVHAAALRLIRSEIDNRCIITDWHSLVNYITASYSRDNVEIFRVLFLNPCNRLLADEIIARGTVNHVFPYPREILKRAIELNATALILIHNHPSGDPTPSKEDIESTMLLITLTSALSIYVHDHIIISQYSMQSFRRLGLLDCDC